MQYFLYDLLGAFRHNILSVLHKILFLFQPNLKKIFLTYFNLKVEILLESQRSLIIYINKNVLKSSLFSHGKIIGQF
jgi:hypothetical protein